MSQPILDLTQLRQEIDTVDTELITLLAQRMSLAAAVGEYKKVHQLPPLDPARWQAVLDSRIELGKKAGLTPDFIKTLFDLIHHHSLALQRQIQAEK